MKLQVWLIAASLFLLPRTGFSQKGGPEPGPGDEVEMTDDDPPPEDEPFSGDISGEEENPTAPVDAFGNPIVTEEEKKEEIKKAGPRQYPQALVARPLTLHKYMSEINLSLPIFVDQFRGEATLRASFAISDEWQVSLIYAGGAFTQSVDDGGVETISGGFHTGKTIAPEVVFQILPWVAAQITVPMWVDPFAAGVTIGAPMKFRFMDDKLSFEFFRDLVNIKIKRFFPHVDDRAQRSYFAGATSTLFNEASVAADEVNTTTVEDDGTINVIGEVTYQLNEKTAIGGRIGVIAPDFDLNDSPVLFDFGILHAKSNKLDFGARIGFRNLDEAAGTFNVTFFTSLRI